MAPFETGRSLGMMFLWVLTLGATIEPGYALYDPPRILVALKTVDGGDLPDSLAQKREYYISKGFESSINRGGCAQRVSREEAQCRAESYGAALHWHNDHYRFPKRIVAVTRVRLACDSATISQRRKYTISLLKLIASMRLFCVVHFRIVTAHRAVRRLR